MKFIFTSILLLTSLSFAQTEPDPFRFFPSAVGNYWEYDHERPNYNYKIVRDSIAEDGSKYVFYFDPPLYYGADYLIDSVGNIYRRPQFSNWLQYKLNADSGDTWIVKEEEDNSRAILAQLRKKGQALVFGELKNTLVIDYYDQPPGDTTFGDDSYYLYTKTLAEDFGLIITEDGAREPEVLLGCIINGKEYGTLVSVESEDEIFYEFSLTQNYPNPFNPTTKISFDLPSSLQGEGLGVRSVKLVVYDILGQEIKTLVNEEKPPGNYSVTFDASGLPSGIYIYKLTAGNLTASKKILLLK